MTDQSRPTPDAPGDGVGEVAQRFAEELRVHAATLARRFYPTAMYPMDYAREARAAAAKVGALLPRYLDLAATHAREAEEKGRRAGLEEAAVAMSQEIDKLRLVHLQGRPAARREYVAAELDIAKNFAARAIRALSENPHV